MKKRLASLFLALALCLGLCVPVLAAETADEIDPSLRLMAELIADWDESYELPDLDALSPEDRETVKALVDAILLAREAQPETEPESVPETEPETQPEPEAQPEDEGAQPISFSDVPTTHTFYKGIMYCAGKGIVNGYADGTFRPTNTVAKSHFVAMLARGFYPDQIAKYDTDQYKNAYGTFGPTNMALASNNILKNTSFQWAYSENNIMSAGINRYDMAQLMTNIMKAKGFAASASQKTAIQAKITDYKNIPSQYQDAVKNVYALGIISGYADGRFVGTNIMNRGQAAIVIQRMAQYAPVTGDKDNDQYDDGTSQKPTPTPDPKPVEPTPTPEPKPEVPETPTGRTLANGKAITESNVTAILNQLKSRYPNGTSFVNGYGGLGSGRNPYSNCIAQIVSTYRTASGVRCSTYGGCGGWAAFVADEIWGQTGVTWKKTTMENARPGDLLIDVDANGYLTHVEIFVGPVNGYPVTKRIYVASATSGKNGYHIGWNMAATSTIITDVYTAYPN